MSKTGALSTRVAEAVVVYRKILGITREQLAERCELTSATLANIETGRKNKQGQRRRHVTVDELVVLAKALDILPMQLLFPPSVKEMVDLLKRSSDDR